MTPVQAQIEVLVAAFRTLPREAQHEVLARSQQADANTTTEVPKTAAHNAAALNLLRVWLADESGYDEQTWPTLKQTMEANRLSDRNLFDAPDR